MSCLLPVRPPPQWPSCDFRQLKIPWRILRAHLLPDCSPRNSNTAPIRLDFRSSIRDFRLTSPHYSYTVSPYLDTLFRLAGTLSFLSPLDSHETFHAPLVDFIDLKDHTMNLHPSDECAPDVAPDNFSTGIAKSASHMVS